MPMEGLSNASFLGKGLVLHNNRNLWYVKYINMHLDHENRFIGAGHNYILYKIYTALLKKKLKQMSIFLLKDQN